MYALIIGTTMDVTIPTDEKQITSRLKLGAKPQLIIEARFNTGPANSSVL